VPPEKSSEPTQAEKQVAAAKPTDDEEALKKLKNTTQENGLLQTNEDNLRRMRAAMLGAVTTNLKGGASSPLASIHIGELTPEMARQLDLPNNVRAVVVTNLDPDGGAAELQKGDVIEEINQQPVTSVADYDKMVASLDPSQPQVLSVLRHRKRSFVVLRPR
jgi:S1-C subfamily serine protease